MRSIIAATLLFIQITPSYADVSEVDVTPPYSREGSVIVPITFGGSVTDMVYTPTNQFLNSSASLGTSLDFVFPSLLEWSFINLELTGSTGAIETVGSFREYGVYSLMTIPSIVIPWGFLGPSGIRIFAGIGLAVPFAGNFAGTSLPLKDNAVFTTGLEVTGNFTNYAHNWHYTGLGITFTQYLQNSPVTSSTSIALHAKVSYDFVLYK